MTGRHWRSRIRAGATGLVSALFAGGCFLFPDPPLWTVHDVERHGGYISAAISSGGETLGFYFEPTPDCEAMLQESAELFYRKFGHLGTLRQEERECVPVGINRIRAWTRRFPTPRNLPILPSLPATFREIHSDSDLVLVRGNFPLSRLVYFAGGRDAVAFLPNIPVCQPHIEQGAGFMQYKRVTQEIIWLGAAAERCQILGLARPLIASEPESQAESGTEPDG